MRHGLSGNKLNRNQSLRKATIRDMAKATLIQQRILTTKAKAKEARKMIDKLITMGKKNTLAHKRRAYSILCDHKVVSELFNQTAPRFKSRAGGYTRIIPVSSRRGDNAKLVYLELTEKSELIVSKPKTGAEAKKDKLKSKNDSAKSKEVKVADETKDVKETKETKDKKVSKVVKDPNQKKDSVKSQSGQNISTQDQQKSGKKIANSIRKIFNRKSSGK